MIKSILLILLFIPSLTFAERFSENGDAVYDSKMKITWQKRSSSGNIIWSDANKFCASLKDNEREDWRLPTITELKSLADHGYGTMVGNLIGILIPTRNYNFDGDYWSSTIDTNSSKVWMYDFHMLKNSRLVSTTDPYQDMHNRALCVIDDATNSTPSTSSPNSQAHTHGNRSHAHPLPVQGKEHKHGDGPIGQ